MEIDKNQPSASDGRPNAFNISYGWKTSNIKTISDPPLQSLLTMTAEPRVYHGYMNGYRQPSAFISLAIKQTDAAQLECLQRAITYYFKQLPLNTRIQSIDEVIACFGEALCALQKAGGIPVFETVQIDKISSHEFTLWVPMLFGGCFHQVNAFLLRLFNHYLQQTAFSVDEQLTVLMNSLIKTLRVHAPQGSNSLNFLKAAFEIKIPWMHVMLNAFQFGQGRYSRWLDSSITDETAKISGNIAGSKRAAAMLLQKTGFPLPEQYVVATETEAVERANRVGYPVVIKPIDQRGGTGVFANLISVQGVRKAFQQASRQTQTVLLEKHIPGKDYRLLVVKGKLAWAIERIPAGVTGDGVNSIQTLVEQHNQRHQAMYPLRYIQISEDALDYLREQQVSLTTVLEAGRFVPLNRIANISAGGTPVGVLDKVHPDNKRLAESAAEILRIDIAGVDFISPDIQKSYRENGGKILEVNVQPQLGSTTAPHIYRQILSTLIHEQGRIPIIVVYGHAQDDFVAQLRTLLSQRYAHVGIARADGAVINGEKIVNTQSLFEAGQHLLLRKELDALIYCINAAHDINAQGLVFDRFDTLFLLQNDLDAMSINTLKKACTGRTLLAGDISQALNDFLH